ncbi:MAG: flavin reductase family protein [Kiritimatiellae bacterium]|nr:flavin reductase family protein [Kiritimatiellia bacterium]
MQKRTTVEQAFKRKYPEPVVLVTSRDKAGRPNVMAVGWTAIVSSGPWMFLLGIDSEALTFPNIRKTREFVIAYPHERMGKAVLHAGSVHGHGRDKLAEAKLKAQKASKVKAPLVADAVANFECKLVRIVTPGDCPLVIGEVVAAHVNTNSKLRRLCTVGPDYQLGGVREARKRRG